jgi:ABC-type uncharacterized transport system involved in gliding motility auxiliary subunit
VVILFSDVDMLYDAFCVQQDPMTGMLVSRTGNLPMILNAVEVLSGGGDLLQVRNRKSAVRPFSTLKEMREKVESRYRPQLMALQAEREKIAEKMGALRLKRDSKGKGFIVDPQQQKDLEALMQNDVDLSRKERDIKKEQNKEIEATKTMLKWLNFLAVPLLVSCVGLLLAVRRRSRHRRCLISFTSFQPRTITHEKDHHPDRRARWAHRSHLLCEKGPQIPSQHRLPQGRGIA